MTVRAGPVLKAVFTRLAPCMGSLAIALEMREPMATSDLIELRDALRRAATDLDQLLAANAATPGRKRITG